MITHGSGERFTDRCLLWRHCVLRLELEGGEHQCHRSLSHLSRARRLVLRPAAASPFASSTLGVPMVLTPFEAPTVAPMRSPRALPTGLRPTNLGAVRLTSVAAATHDKRRPAAPTGRLPTIRRPTGQAGVSATASKDLDVNRQPGDSHPARANVCRGPGGERSRPPPLPRGLHRRHALVQKRA